MKTKIDTIREALNVSRAGHKAMCREDYVDMIDEALDALSDLEAHPQTEDLEARAREWWLKHIMLIDDHTRLDVKLRIAQGSAADQAVEMLTAFVRSLSPSKGVDAQAYEQSLRDEIERPCDDITGN